ncbi:MAG: leucine-rich repeat domain-containing protein [Candidatus Cloacimonetes bacterium]|nr:leucine-rich repeat domain-containing protein [Candidatus Cloacimonadota bacterium]
MSILKLVRYPNDTLNIPETAGAPLLGPVITGYDLLSRTVSGKNFGVFPGMALVFDRLLNDYVPVDVLSWSDSAVVLGPLWDTKDGDSAVMIMTSFGVRSYGYNIYYSAPLNGWCRVTVDINGDIRQYELLQSQYSSILLSNGDIRFDEIFVSQSKMIGIEFGVGFNLNTIGNNFLNRGYRMMQPLLLPNCVTQINDYVCQNNVSFNNALKLPDNLTTIGTYFLENCLLFNQPLDIPQTVTNLGSYFMSFCGTFNQALVFNNVVTVNTYFMNNCYSFNKPLIFEKPIRVGNYFMNNCYSFNQAFKMNIAPTSSIIVPTSHNFMNNVLLQKIEVSLAIGSTITIQGPFLHKVNSLEYIVWNASLSHFSANNMCFLTVENMHSRSYMNGIKVYGKNRSELIARFPRAIMQGISPNAYRGDLINGGSDVPPG